MEATRLQPERLVSPEDDARQKDRRVSDEE